MSNDVELEITLERKAQEFDLNKEHAINRLKENIRMATEKLRQAEEEIAKEIEVVYGRNIFAEELSELRGGSNTQERTNIIAAFEVPNSVGPSEKSFSRLIDEIGRFREWKHKQNKPEAPPKIFVTSGTYDKPWSTANVEWVKDAGDDVRYQLQVQDGIMWKENYEGKDNKCTVSHLVPGETYNLRVRCVINDETSNWSQAIEIRAPTTPAPKNLRCEDPSHTHCIITWDSSEYESRYELEMSNIESGITKHTYTCKDNKCWIQGLNPGMNLEFRVREVLGEKSFGEWSDKLNVRIKWDSWWKECPDYVQENMQYSVSKDIPRIVSKNASEVLHIQTKSFSGKGQITHSISRRTYNSCSENHLESTIIGNATLPQNKVTSWSIKY